MLSRHHLGNLGSSKEKRIWATKEKKIRARRNNRKRHSLVRRTNEKRKEKRRTNRCPVLFGGAFSGVDPETRRAMPEYYDLDVSVLGIEPRSWRRLRIISAGSAEVG